MKSERRIERLSYALRHTQRDLTVVLENIHDPHNVSAILRTCDAVGVRKVNLVYTSEIFPSIGKKSSASANKWVERKKFRSVGDCYRSLREEGFTIAASAVKSGSVSLYELDLTGRVALVFGNEHRGVTDEASASADVRFQIPMHGMIQSLNVSVACAVSLYECLRQRIVPTTNSDHFLDERDVEKLLKEWERK